MIANKLPHLSDIPICFMTSDEEKKQNRKIVHGQCYKVNQRYKYFCPYEFMIVIYEQNVCSFSDRQLEILIEHELRHCGIDDSGNETKYYVVPHDVEDFNEIINQYGLYWDKEG